MHLPATLASGDAPFAEVFTVISENVIHVFAKPRTRSDYDLGVRKRRRGMRESNNAFPVGESLQRHFLDGAALPSVAKTGVMHYPSVPYVDAVMRVENPVSDYMGAGRK